MTVSWRGVFPAVSQREDSHVAEEIARAAQVLAQRGIGALVVVERETHVLDLIEAADWCLVLNVAFADVLPPRLRSALVPEQRSRSRRRAAP